MKNNLNLLNYADREEGIAEPQSIKLPHGLLVGCCSILETQLVNMLTQKEVRHG